MSERKTVNSVRIFSRLLIFSFISISLIQFAEGICPDAKSIEPCTCDDEGLQCLRLADDDELGRVFSANAQRKAIRSVWIFQTELTRLKRNAFGDYIIRDLFIDINKISSIDVDAFGEASKTLKTLSLTRNLLSSFPFDVLKKLTRIDKLSLNHNQLSQLPSNIKSDTLTQLELSNNRITDIAPNTFYSMNNLRVLDLAHNKLRTIKTDALSINSTAPNIVLRSNQIETFELRPFGSNVIKALDISQNGLSYLDEEVFLPLIMNGTEIGVGYNPFVCAGCENYRWLVEKRDIIKGKLVDFQCLDSTELEQLTLSRVGCE